MIVIGFIYSIIGTPLGYVLYFIYNFICKNVGVDIILFTFIIKAALLPLYIKQQKSTARSAVFMPKVKEIQDKYRNNPAKQQEEMQKLQQQGYKPYGCLTMLLPLIILFGVIDVVYKPLTHIIHTSGAQVSAMVEESYNIDIASLFVDEYNRSEDEISKFDEKALKKHTEIMRDGKKLLDFYNANCLKDGETAKTDAVLKKMDKETVEVFRLAIRGIIADEYSKDVNKTVLSDAGIYKITDDEKKQIDAAGTPEEKEALRAQFAFGENTINALNTLQNHYGFYKAASTDSIMFNPSGSLQRELYSLECFGTEKNGTAYKTLFSERVINDNLRGQIEELYENLNFAGIPLGQVPVEHMGFPMILVPILSFVLSLAQTFISMRQSKKTNPDMKTMGCMTVFMFIMPVISLWIAFTVPAGAGFYWAVSYVFGIAQTLILNKIYDPVKLREAAAAEMKITKQKVVTVEAVKEKVIDEETGETLTQKEINRRKLAEARKADALKYGEEYREDDDED